LVLVRYIFNTCKKDTYLFLRDLGPDLPSDEYGRRAVERRIVGAAGQSVSALSP